METHLKRGRSYIYSAILKDGLENFSLEILEFCEPEMCIKREDYYIKLLNSAYNIIKDPLVPPMYGRNHSEETIKKISDALKGSKRSDETRKKMSDAHKKIDHSGRFQPGEINPMFGRNHSDESRSKISANHNGGKPSQKISVLDTKTNETKTYDSISEAARALNIKQASISQYFSNNRKKPYNKLFLFIKV
jgi:group I intron endonuclease